MKRNCKSIIALFLFAAAFLLQPGIIHSLAAAPELIASVYHEAEISMWHYSRGYWFSESYNLKIDDSQVRLDPELLAEAMGKYVEFKIPLPDAVKSAIAKGDTITADYSVSGAGDRFDTSKGVTYRFDSNNLYFKAFPKFHFLKKPNYKDYINELDKFIPFVDPDYGYNYYSIWTRTNPTNLGSNTGYLDKYDWYKLPAPGSPESTRVHPSQIKNTAGHFVDGFTVSVYKNNTPQLKPSGQVSAGSGTFQNAGAVGFGFIYPLTFTFYREPSVPVNLPDVAVTKIVETQYTEGLVCTAKVSVKNNGSASVKTEVSFTIPSVIDTVDTVTIAPGETKEVPYYFIAPKSGTITMTAEANKKRLFTESDYSNNKKTQTATIKAQPGLIGDSTTCGTEIIWTEEASHPVNGLPCTHTFKYKASLATTHSITPKTLKSGYGFEVEVTNTVSTVLAQHIGCGSWGDGRKPDKTAVAPTAVSVYVNWTVSNRLGTQGNTNNLERKASNSNAWVCKKNPISEIKAQKIYTDVALAGTKTSPKTHPVTININGGGVKDVTTFCKKITESITINGSMYEDDHTGP